MKKNPDRLTPLEIETVVRKVEETFQEQGFEILNIKADEMVKPNANIDWDKGLNNMTEIDFIMYTGEMNISLTLKYGLGQCNISNVYDKQQGHFKLWVLHESNNFNPPLEIVINNRWKSEKDYTMLPLLELFKAIKCIKT